MAYNSLMVFTGNANRENDEQTLNGGFDAASAAPLSARAAPGWAGWAPGTSTCLWRVRKTRWW